MLIRFNDSVHNVQTELEKNGIKTIWKYDEPTEQHPAIAQLVVRTGDRPIYFYVLSPSEMGRKGGTSKSEAKQKASRKNGKLGGRPKKKK